MNRAAATLWLATVWVVLWESYDLRAILGGLAVASVLVLAFPGERRGGLDAFRPIAVLRFVGLFGWQVLKANAIVSWEVVTPGERVNEGIVAVPVTGASDAVVTVLANVISLTPGTLIIEVERDPTVLYVHVLHLRDLDQVRLDIFRLERALVLAIGTSASLDDVDERIRQLCASHPELDPPPTAGGAP